MVVAVDKDKRIFFVCKDGSILQPWKYRPEIFFKGKKIEGNKSRYIVKRDKDIAILNALNEGEIILFPFGFNKKSGQFYKYDESKSIVLPASK